MSSKAYFAEEVRERAKELDSPEDTLCVGSVTMSSYSSSARSNMVAQHLVQALVPNKPEVPGVATSYEELFGAFSTSYKKTTSKLKVVKKIVKHENYVYTLLVYNSDDDMYDIVQRKEVKNMAESYGFKYNNETIDSYDEGDIIPKKTVLYKSPCMDDDENFMFGLNAKVVYVTSQETIEDSIVISKSFAKKFSVTKVDTCEIPFNDNDIFLNIYGDNEQYKSFPDVGEKIKDSVLCATRRKNKVLDQLYLKNSNLKKIFPNDDVFQLLGDYKVVDIDVWANKPYDELPTAPAYDQVKFYYNRMIEYYTDIYNIFGDIIDKGYNYSQEFSQLYAKARDFLDPSCKYVDEERMFSNLIVEFTLMKSEPLRRGCKLCGKYQSVHTYSNMRDYSI